MPKTKLKILPEGVLEPNDEANDPLRHYYHPLLGHLYRRRIEEGLSLLRPPYKRILEVGYGSGVLLPHLAGIGEEVYGVDTVSDPEKTTETLAKFGIHTRLFRADICEWEHTGEAFDLVVAFSVFEHISDPSRVFARLSRLIRPDGFLLVGVPRVDRIMAPLFSLIGFKGIEEHHVTTPREICEGAMSFFRIERTATFPSFLPRCCALYFNYLFHNPASGMRDVSEG